MRRVTFGVRSLAALGVLSVIVAATAVDRPARVEARGAPASAASARIAYDRLPLAFMENRGQTDPRV